MATTSSTTRPHSAHACRDHDCPVHPSRLYGCVNTRTGERLRRHHGDASGVVID